MAEKPLMGIYGVTKLRQATAKAFFDRTKIDLASKQIAVREMRNTLDKGVKMGLIDDWIIAWDNCTEARQTLDTTVLTKVGLNYDPVNHQIGLQSGLQVRLSRNEAILFEAITSIPLCPVTWQEIAFSLDNESPYAYEQRLPVSEKLRINSLVRKLREKLRDYKLPAFGRYRYRYTETIAGIGIKFDPIDPVTGKRLL